MDHVRSTQFFFVSRDFDEVVWLLLAAVSIYRILPIKRTVRIEVGLLRLCALAVQLA